jgi:hypothetical protein
MAALIFALSAAIVAPALGVQSSSIFSSPTTYVPEETTSKDVESSQASPTGTVSPYSLDLSPPSDVAEPSTAPTAKPAVEATPTPVATLSPTPVAGVPAPQETSAPAPTPTQAPAVQQPPTDPVVGVVTVSQVFPTNGGGEAVLQWSSIPGATEYRIFKTGTIRPSWRLFYVYPSSITSITIFDKPGAIAIYKIMVVVDSKETLLGEVVYKPTN